MRRSPVLVVLVATMVAVAATAVGADDNATEDLPYLPDRLVFATADTAPFSRPDGTGLYDRMIRASLDDLGVELEIQRRPSLRGLVEASSGRIDGEYGRAEVVLNDFPSLLRVPTPLSDYSFVAVGLPGRPRPDVPLPRTFADLANLDVAYINGWQFFATNVTDYRSLTVVADEEQLFAMLAAERVNVILYDRLRAQAWAAAHPGIPIEIAEVPFAVRTMHLLLSPRHADLVAPISAALERVRRSDDYLRWYTEAFRTTP